MKILVVGSEGSIGTKRKLILESVGHKVEGVDVKTEKQMSSKLVKEFDAVLLCTPPNTLCKLANECIEAETPFFMEKPGATCFREFIPIVNAVEKKGMPSMVACNLRFTAEYRAIEEALPNIGKPLYANAEFGYFLPWWRDGQYRTYYSAYRMAGGGILMDAIHEIDYVTNLFGPPSNLKACMVKIENSGELADLDSEDSATLLGIYKTGPAITIHLDYLQRAYKRTFCAVGTKGRIDQTFNVQGSTDMYKREMQHFLDCVKKGDDTLNPVSRWSGILEFVDNMRSNTKKKEEDD